MDGFTSDIVALFKKRAYDIAGVMRGLKVTVNGKLVNFSDYKEYSQMYFED